MHAKLQRTSHISTATAAAVNMQKCTVLANKCGFLRRDNYNENHSRLTTDQNFRQDSTLDSTYRICYSTARREMQLESFACSTGAYTFLSQGNLSSQLAPFYSHTVVSGPPFALGLQSQHAIVVRHHTRWLKNCKYMVLQRIKACQKRSIFAST